VFHKPGECEHKHFIRPVLFAFCLYGLPDLKEFVKVNLGVSAWEEGLDSFKKWLGKSPGSEAPNHIKLYWWILMFRGRLPRA